MRRLWTFLFLAVLALAAMPAAFAGNGTNGTNGTNTTMDDDVDEMTTGLGARMRLLQLERQLERSIIQAEAVIETLETRGNNTTNLTRMRDIVA
ncbi:MAG: hypothetical protein MUD01_06410, partial [Chloroflexaceae bacterium]|nr:hypothetical protein [Chloroflexaceae bacterium]